MSCFLPAECKAFLIRLNILQIPGQWVIMSTSIVHFKASLQSLPYLHNTKMTFISQRDKGTLGSSASQGRDDALHMDSYQLHSEARWDRPVGHRTVKSCSVSTGKRALANARQGGVNLQANIIPLLAPAPNPLALGALDLKQSGLWFSCLSSLAALLHPASPPECPSLAAAIVSSREGCHSMAGTHAQKSCSNWLNLPSFPRAYRSMIHLQLSVPRSPLLSQPPSLPTKTCWEVA